METRPVILIVDDEPHFISAYVEALEIEGFDVKVVPEENEFFDLLELLLPEAVVIDVMLLSGYDAGWEILKQFRFSHPKIPAILLTNKETVNPDNQIDSSTRILIKRDTTPIKFIEVLNSLLKSN